MASRGRRGSGEHREFEDMAVAHVVGGLSLDEGRLFRSHLLECTSCRARVGELRAIAHDLADVERDERRERAARRTETKARESDEGELPAHASPRLSGRTTLVVAAGLTILMALSAWNFVLRGRLQQSENTMALLRESVTVLQDGQEWPTVRSSTSVVDGQVSTLPEEEDLVVMVHGLVDQEYELYVFNAEGGTIHRDDVAAIDGMLYEYLDDEPGLASAHRLLLTRADTEVFEAERADPEQATELQPVGEPTG